MPELPEVETIKRDLVEKVINKDICSVKILLPRVYINKENIDLKGRIEKISRVGKYLIFDIEHNCSVIIHLRMTGKLIYSPVQSGFEEKHIRVIFNFSERDCLIFHDVRTFGKIELIPYKSSVYGIKNIGIDALAKEFTLKKFSEICERKKVPIKNMLLDQTLIAGIGNIYAQEILFEARVSPCKMANLLNKKELKLIHQATINILNLAIKHNGTSISDFRRVDDKTGEFQNFLKVYGKKICPVCGQELFKIKQGGRSTSYCDHCQR